MVKGELEKLTRHLEKVTAQLIQHGYAPAPEGASQNGPGEDFEEEEVPQSQSGPDPKLPAEPLSTDEAKRLLVGARDVGKAVGAHGMDVMAQVLKSMELGRPEKNTVAAWMDYLTTFVGAGDTNTIREQLTKIEQEGF
jgi:hypothetical protein